MAEPITTPCQYRYPDDPDGPPCGHPADAWRHTDPRGHRYAPEPAEPSLDGTDLARVLAILDPLIHVRTTHDETITTGRLASVLAEARTIVERHILAHPEPVATGPGDPELLTPGERAAAGWTPEPEPTCSVPGCHDEDAHERYRAAADTAAEYRERAATMQRRALAASIEANRAERAWRQSMAPKPTCRHCGSPDLAPWDAADAGMAGDYCARCVDDAVLGAPCPACGNVPGDDDPCPSR